jgi:hypothetical protein
VLGGVRWSRRDVAEFLGCHLSEPKPHVRFFRPDRPLGRTAFARALLATLADERRLPARTSFTQGAAALVYTWYRAGHLVPGDPNG